jgi:hypothetical protein
MTPKNTNARRKINNFASRAAGNAESFRNQVSLFIFVQQNAVSRATPVGAPRWGHQSGPGSGRGATCVLQKHSREPPIANAVGGMLLHSAPAANRSFRACRGPREVCNVRTPKREGVSGKLKIGKKYVNHILRFAKRMFRCKANRLSICSVSRTNTQI